MGTITHAAESDFRANTWRPACTSIVPYRATAVLSATSNGSVNHRAPLLAIESASRATYLRSTCMAIVPYNPTAGPIGTFNGSVNQRAQLLAIQSAAPTCMAVVPYNRTAAALEIVDVSSGLYETIDSPETSYD